MTKIHNKKLLLAAILPAVATVAIVAFLLSSSTHEAQAVQTPAGQMGSIGLDVETSDSFLAKGGRSVVKIEMPINEVKLTRGVTTSVDLHIHHVAGINPFTYVSVTLLPPNGYIWYSAALTASTTPEQRLHAAETGQLIPGSIDLGKIVSFSETKPVTVGAGSEQVVKMYITMPKDLPDNVIGQGGYLNIPIKAADNNGDASTVYADSSGINFQVVG
jgi:hypothetical protein